MNYRNADPSMAQAKRASKIKVQQQVQVEAERQFGLTLGQNILPSVENPWKLFQESFRFRLQGEPATAEQDHTQKGLLIAILIQKLLNDPKRAHQTIDDLFGILSGDKRKALWSAYDSKKASAVKATAWLSFRAPKDAVWLHKKGKLFGKTVLRQALMGWDQCGQLKDPKKEKIAKPLVYADQEVWLEPKTHALAAKTSSQLPPDTLKWAEKSETQDYSFRLKLRDLHSAKATFLYVKDQKDAEILRNQIIVSRLTPQDTKLRSKLGRLAKAWKARVAESFYGRRLRGFLRDPDNAAKLFQETDQLKALFHEFIQSRFPQLSQAPTEVANVIDLGREVKLEFVHSPTDAQDFKQQFATLVTGNPLGGQPEGLNLLNVYADSPFQVHEKRPRSLAPIARNHLVSPSDIPQTSLPPNDSFANILAKSCRILLSLRKLLLLGGGLESGEGVLSPEALIFEARLGTGSKRSGCTSLSFLEEVRPNFAVFALQNSLEVEFGELPSVELALFVKNTSKQVFGGAFDLQKLDSFLSLECHVPREVTLRSGGAERRAIAVFGLTFVPQNLETAHCLVDSALLSTSFQGFSQAVKRRVDCFEFIRTFLTPGVGEGPSTSEFDCFSFLNRHLPRSSTLLRRQESAYFKSFGHTSATDLLGELDDLARQSVSLNEVFLHAIIKTDRIPKAGENRVFDILCRGLGLLTATERLLVSRLNLARLHRHFVPVTGGSLQNLPETHLFEPSSLSSLNQKVSEYLAAHPHLTLQQRSAIRVLVVDLHLHLCNNRTDSEKLSIRLLPQHVPLVAHLVVLNHRQLSSSSLLLLAAEAVLETLNLSVYSPANQLLYLDVVVTYFKVAFSHLFPESFAEWSAPAVDWDLRLADLLLSSLASALPPLLWAVYQDFKQLLVVVLGTVQPRPQLFGHLSRLGITLPHFIDCVFLAGVIHKSVHLFRGVWSPDCSGSMDAALQRELSLGPQALFFLLESLKRLVDAEIDLPRALKIEKDLRERRREIAGAVSSLRKSLATQKVSPQSIQESIRKFLEMPHVMGSYLATFPVRNAFLEDPEADFGYHTLPKLVSRDLFFEILPVREWHEARGVSSDPRAIQNYEESLVELHCLQREVVATEPHPGEGATTFGNCIELSADEIRRLLHEDFGISADLAKDIFQDLTCVVKSKTVSLIRLFVFLVCAANFSIQETVQSLTDLCRQVTRLFFPEESTRLLLPAAEAIYLELRHAIPMLFLPTFPQNHFGIQTGKANGVVGASVNFRGTVVDLTRLLQRHFASQSLVSGQPSLGFGSQLAGDLRGILQSLLAEGSAAQPKDLELSLQLIVGGEDQRLEVPFKVALSDKEVDILFLESGPFFFGQGVSEDQLVPPTSFDRLIRECSLGVANPFFDLKSLSWPSPQGIEVRLADSQGIFLLRVGFSGTGVSRCEAAPWNFRTDESLDNSLRTPGVSVNLPRQAFLWPMHEGVALGIQIAKETLPEPDFFPFLRRFSGAFTLRAASGKVVAPEATFWEGGETAQKGLEAVFK